MNLRDYQREGVDCMKRALQENTSTLLVWATGLGKTVAFAHLIKEFLAGQGQGAKRVMVMAHRGELLEQAGKKIEAICGVHCETEKAEQYADRQRSGLITWKAPVILTSVQTQIAARGEEQRMNRFDPNEFGMLIVDEAHHATSQTWRQVIDYYKQNPSLKVVGLTATPNRHDEESLRQIFDPPAHEMGLIDGILNGWLVDLDAKEVYVKTLDLSKCRTTAGDLNGKDLASVMEFEETLHEVVKPTIKIADGRKTLVFAASVAHAERMTEIFNRHNEGSACFIHGGTPKQDRKEILDRFRSGSYRVLCNCGIATEGFDIPDIEVIACARPTKSLPLYTQMIGRGTRVLAEINVDQYKLPVERVRAIHASTKPSLLVLDFVGNSGRHKLVNVVDALAGRVSDGVIDLAKIHLRDDEQPRNVREILTQAEEQERLNERNERQARTTEEERRRRGLRPDVIFELKTVNPFDVLDVSTAREPGWHKGRVPSEKMVEALGKFGIKDGEDLTYSAAHQLLDVVISKARRNGCTFGHAKYLQKRGFPIDCTFDQAKRWMDEISASGWRLRFDSWCRKHGTKKYDQIPKDDAA